MITATNNLTTQKNAAALNVKSSGIATQKADLQKYNINVKEQNKSFLHNPQVRPAGFSDLGKPRPNTGPNTALPDPNGPTVKGRGGKLDISA